MWYCYILRNTDPHWSNQTYNGSTNNPIRRLRQHNEEISGGARATHGKGGAWEIYALVRGFPDHVNALSCEWRIKHPSGKPGRRDARHCGVRGRIVGLAEVLRLPFWTKQCVTENCSMNLDVWVTAEHAEILGEMPTNVHVHVVEKMDRDFLAALQVEDKENE